MILRPQTRAPIDIVICSNEALYISEPALKQKKLLYQCGLATINDMRWVFYIDFGIGAQLRLWINIDKHQLNFDQHRSNLKMAHGVNSVRKPGISRLYTLKINCLKSNKTRFNSNNW